MVSANAEPLIIVTESGIITYLINSPNSDAELLNVYLLITVEFNSLIPHGIIKIFY